MEDRNMKIEERNEIIFKCAVGNLKQSIEKLSIAEKKCYDACVKALHILSEYINE